jgi:hypothetical protein
MDKTTILYQRELNNKQFKIFLNGLKILVPHCTDLQVVEGKVRTRTDCLTQVVEVDFTKVLPDASFSIKGLKYFVEELEDFSRGLTSCLLLFTIYESYYKFEIIDHDGNRSITMENISLIKEIDIQNKFLSEEDLKNVV